MKILLTTILTISLFALSAIAQERQGSPKDNDRQGPPTRIQQERGHQGPPPWAQAQRGERGPRGSMMQQERGRQGPPPWAQARRGNGPEVKKGECYCKCPCHNQQPGKDIKKNKKGKKSRR